MCPPTHALVPVCPKARVAGLLLAALRGLALCLPLLWVAESAGAQELARLIGGVVDAESGVSLSDVKVTLRGPGGAEPPGVETRTTGGDGSFDFGEVPVGIYQFEFERSGYRSSRMTDFRVLAGEINRAEFPMPGLAAEATADEVAVDETAGAGGGSGADGGAEVGSIEEFVVTAEKVEDLISLRIDSDSLLNVVGAEEFSKFGAGDVAEVLERVAGVTVAEGQFAIIRGLEDRYSSTVLNGAVVPSPDPNSQSVQLDLFPSEVVGNLGVVKNFSPELPSNSSGGNIDIKTHEYPEEVEVSFKAGAGFNENAQDRYLEQQGHTDVEQIVNGLDPIGTDANGLPIYETREEFQARAGRFVGGNPFGLEDEKNGNFFDDLSGVTDSDYVATLGGKEVFGGREFRFKGVLSRETDYETAEGFQGERVPAPAEFSLPTFGPPIFIPRPPFVITPIIPGKLISPGDLTLGELNRYKGTYDMTLSERVQQSTAFGALGFDLDEEGAHRVDGSYLWTRVKFDAAQLLENGIIPGLDYEAYGNSQIVDAQLPSTGGETIAPGGFIEQSFRDPAFGPLEDGTLAFSSFSQSTSFETDRELWVAAVNGDHDFGAWLPGLHLNWAWNEAETTQQESALGMSVFYEPCGFTSLTPCPPGVQPIQEVPTVYPTTPESLGPGAWAVRNDILLSANDITESSSFYRIDADYEVDFSEAATFELTGGLWKERANRNVASAFLESPSVSETGEACVPGASSQFVCQADTEIELGEVAYEEIAFTGGNLSGLRSTTNDSSREIDAWHLRGKLSFWDRVDLLGGVRLERIFIQSLNDPFLRNPLTGELVTILGGPQTFPSRFVLFDRIDNPFPGGPDGLTVVPPEDLAYNDEILGTGVVPGKCVGDDGSKGAITCVDLLDADDLQDRFNGLIDERRLFPSAGITIRPLEGLILRGAWSETVARPSFREIGYYVTVEPGTNDLLVGNPTLQLSDVQSWDARLEYTWGFRGDLFAVSWFKKKIDNPIEAVIVRDPLNQELTASGLFQTFFNNPNTADLWGVEVEARKNFDFLELLEEHAGVPMPDWLEYLSVGGNYTYIDAEVARTSVEQARAQPFFEGASQFNAAFSALAPTRRLFNQPEWIANVDVTFDHPDWGLSATVAYFAISDVLDAAGSVAISNTGRTLEYVPDRYVGAFQDLRATIAKTFMLPANLGAITLRASAKNLLDSPRRLIYDPAQTSKEIVEQELRTGIDYGLSITFRREF